jgi:putative FmdB family regulatory protein
MPLFDYLCLECGKVNEVLVAVSGEQPQCPACSSTNLKKLLSAHSSISGASKSRVPGRGDTACCGSTPSQASCAGPGTCCGK